MRNWIRSWLGVSESPAEVKKLVKEAVREALEPEYRYRIKMERIHSPFWDDEDDGSECISGIVQQYVKALAVSTTYECASVAVKEQLEPESVLDGIVERLKRKQL